jgi:hypothetical protein
MIELDAPLGAVPDATAAAASGDVVDAPAAPELNRDNWHRLSFGDDAGPPLDDAALDELDALFRDDSGRLP